MKDGISGGSGIPANRNKFVDRGNAPLNRAEYESRKASIFGDNDVEELKRTVGNDEKHEILVGRDKNGKKVRVDAKTLEELVTVETTGKNTYMTKSEFNKLIEQVLHVKELPAGMTAEFQHGNLVFKRGGDVLTAKDLREDAGLIAQRQKEKLEAEREMTQKLLEDVKPLSLTPDLDMSKLSEVKIKNLPSPTATVALQDTPAPAPKPSATPARNKRIVNNPTTAKKKPANNPASRTPTETATPPSIARPSDNPVVIRGAGTWNEGQPLTTEDNLKKGRQQRIRQTVINNGNKMGEAAKGHDIDKKIMHEHIRNINNIPDGNVMNFIRAYDKGNGITVLDIIQQLARYNTPASRNAALKLLYGASKECHNDPVIESIAQTIDSHPNNWGQYALTADRILFNTLNGRH